jgi:hypothetical protein
VLLFRHEEMTTDNNNNDAPAFIHDDDFVDDVCFGAPSRPTRRGGGRGHSGSSSEPIDNRKRVVRFLQDEDLDESLDHDGGGGLLLATAGGAGLGMAAAGGAAGMLLPFPSERNNDGSFSLFDEQQLSGSDTSIGMLDVFGEGDSGNNNNNSSNRDMNASGGTSMIEKDDHENDDDDSANPFDEDEEKEKQMRKSLMITVVGVGFLGLLGFGGKKLMSALNRGGSNDDNDIAADVIGEAADVATEAHEVAHIGGHIAGEGVAGSSSSQAGAAATQASFNASANASSSNALMGAGVGNNAGAMNGAQYVYSLRTCVCIYIYTIGNATTFVLNIFFPCMPFLFLSLW